MNKFRDNMYEYEHVFLADYGCKLLLNLEEIEDVEWVELGDLERRLCADLEIFASWFLIAAPRVLGNLSRIRAA